MEMKTMSRSEFLKWAAVGVLTLSEAPTQGGPIPVSHKRIGDKTVQVDFAVSPSPQNRIPGNHRDFQLLFSSHDFIENAPPEMREKLAATMAALHGGVVPYNDGFMFTGPGKLFSVSFAKSKT